MSQLKQPVQLYACISGVGQQSVSAANDLGLQTCRIFARHVLLQTTLQGLSPLYLIRDWLPKSGCCVADFPMFSHYVNVGSDVREAEMITNVFLPVRDPEQGAVLRVTYRA